MVQIIALDEDFIGRQPTNLLRLLVPRLKEATYFATAIFLLRVSLTEYDIPTLLWRYYGLVGISYALSATLVAETIPLTWPLERILWALATELRTLWHQRHANDAYVRGGMAEYTRGLHC
eukprot:scaffold366168_cov14-Prasinocladus_malaysianus.AAC.1